MNYVEKYQNAVKFSRALKPTGYFPYKVRPRTEQGEIAFGKKIQIVVEKEPISLFRMILKAVDLKKTKSVLTEENYRKAGFDKNIDIAYFDGEPKTIESLILTIIENTIMHMERLSITDITVELGDFVPYPNEEKLDFDDIPDLRFTTKGGE